MGFNWEIMHMLKLFPLLVLTLACFSCESLPKKSHDLSKNSEVEKTLQVKTAHVQNLSELKKHYSGKKYNLKDIRNYDADLPHISLNKLPSDWDQLSYQDKKSLFIKVVLPLILQNNEEISQERDRFLVLSKLNKEALTNEELAFLEKLYQKYKTKDPQQLRQRIDLIPPSIAVAQAIEESGWGMSYFALKGNALYGQVGTSGLRARKNTSRFVRDFPDLLSSIRSYSLNLNTHKAYKKFRQQRAEMRQSGEALDAYLLVNCLDQYSTKKGQYVKNIKKIIELYDLEAFDAVTLNTNNILKIETLGPKLNKKTKK